MRNDFEEIHEPDQIWPDWEEHQERGGPGAPTGGISAEELIDALPGLTRITGQAAWHTGLWAVGASQRLAGRMARAAVSPREAIVLADDTRRVAAKALRVASQILDETGGIGPQLRPSTPARTSPAGPDANSAHPRPHSRPSPQPLSPLRPDPPSRDGRAQSTPQRSLRERANDLLELSRDVEYEPPSHPAYERIIDELAPDEARILLLLLLDGPQPSVDVRTGGPVGMVRSRLIAPGLSMIGARAGVRFTDRVPAYLNNLFRLGLVWFAREALPDTSRYQLLEAQPDVAEAMKSTSYAKVVRRSVHLTPFGEDFCRTALAPAATRIEALPEHALPTEEHEDKRPGA